MVTRLYYFKTKKSLLRWCRDRGYSLRACEKAWTGPGYYYARGKAHISKHVPHLDRRRGKKIGRGPWRHVHDAVGRIVRSLKKRADREAEKLARRTLRRIARKKKPPKRLREKTLELARVKLAKRAARRARRGLSPAVKELAEYLWRQIPKKYKRGRDRVWTYVAVLALARQIYKRAREKGVDPYQYDWAQLIDWSLGYREALDYVKQAIGKTQEELHRESLERWEYLRRRYQEEKEEALREFERELDEIIKYELDHLDEIIGF